MEKLFSNNEEIERLTQKKMIAKKNNNLIKAAQYAMEIIKLRKGEK